MLLGSLAVLAGPGCSATIDSTEDARVVFCLSKEQQPRLTQAAAALDLVKPGSAADRVVKDGHELSLADWRTQRRADFDRTCAALAAPPYSPSLSGTTNGLVGTLNVLVGAFVSGVGFLAAYWRDRMLRNERQSRALHSAITAFVSAGESYLWAWSDDTAKRPVDTTVHERRSDLAAELHSVLVSYPDSKPFIKRVLSIISDLDEDMAASNPKWKPEDKNATVRRVRDLRDGLGRLVTDIDEIAHALEHPFQRNSILRRPTSPVPREASS